MAHPIIYLHGANASPSSFTYLRDNLPEHPLDLAPSYQVDDGLAANTRSLVEYMKLVHGNQPFDIIAHSMGGLIAVGLARAGLNIRRIITLGTPFGGSAAAGYLKWLYPGHHMFDDISPNSSYLTSLRATPLGIPVDAFVTHGGRSPLMGEPNDGVVTVASQMAFPGARYHRIDLNHFESLLSSHVVEQISDLLEE